jgi:hypothetical protein
MLQTHTTERDAPTRDAQPTSRLPLWEWNRRVGWVSACVGIASGLVMGLWSFDGPFPVPSWLGEYDQTSRRLARLGHIAFLGLGILNILVARELCRLTLGRTVRRTASLAMNFGNIFLPLTLFAAAAYRPLKYAMGAPAVAVFVALVVTAWGVCCSKARSDGGGPGHDQTA